MLEALKDDREVKVSYEVLGRIRKNSQPPREFQQHNLASPLTYLVLKLWRLLLAE